MRRSRSVPLAALLVGVALAVHAPPVGAAAVGALVGMHHGGISGDAPPDVEFGSRTGLLAGLHGEIGIAPDVLLCIEPMFVSRGASIADADTVADDLGTLTIDYVAVPVLLKIVAGGGRTFVTGGIDLAFLDSATLSGGGAEADATDRVAQTSVSAILGFGVVFPIGGPRLTVEARYIHGLTNLADSDAGPVDDDLPGRFHTAGLQLAAGVLFSLGRP